MKNKDFNLIKYLASKNIFITEDNIKDKKFKMVQVLPDAARGSSSQKTLKYSLNTIRNKSRNTNITLHGGQKIIFVDFKNKQINKKRGLKNV